MSNTWQGWYANGTTSWLKWQLPKTIKIKSLKAVSCYYSSGSYYQFQGRFYTSSDKTVPLGDAFSFDSWNQTKTVANIPEEGIITDCIYLDKTGGGYYSGVQEIYIEAEEQTYEWRPWSTPEETWTEQEKWKQPTPTANDSDGTFSASTETTSHEAYRITTSDGWTSNATDAEPYVQWVLPSTISAVSTISFASDDVKSCEVYNGSVLMSTLEQTDAKSGFSLVPASDLNLSTLKIKPLTSFNGTLGENVSVSIKDLRITGGSVAVTKSNVIDFVMPSLTDYSQNGYEVTCSQPQRSRYATNNSTYYSWYTYSNQAHSVIDFPPIIGCLAELYYMYLLESNIDTGLQPKVFKNLDFFATTINNPSWISDSNWWLNNSSSSYQRVMPMSFQNPRNICTSINLSQFSGLNHDSLIALLRALVSRKGISAATLTIGSQNLAKLTSEEKAIATEKNWNLA
uniref:Uncharacterized protein n=1 Tax=Siphoviridae sp. ctYh54 TaxID=2826379 RepID=A0A8S5ME53_9CAUD|nr:MAG TPA: hypothetical protein [Siphoviridae sp. ctYh54]